MPYTSNREIREAPPGYEPAKILQSGMVQGPRCCGDWMQNVGECSSGCCDDYKCATCGHSVRIEWPD